MGVQVTAGAVFALESKIGLRSSRQKKTLRDWLEAAFVRRNYSPSPKLERHVPVGLEGTNSTAMDFPVVFEIHSYELGWLSESVNRISFFSAGSQAA